MTGEDPCYLSRQLVTCLGNKRALLGPIAAAVERVKGRLGRDRLTILDGFSGSGVVSRLFKRHAAHLHSNDLEPFAAAVGRSFLHDRDDATQARVVAAAADLNAVVDTGPAGFVRELYAPRDEAAIQPGERAFYTPANAARLDAYRQRLDGRPPDVREALLGPLLAAASVHANTAGVFKGFYKDRRTGTGRYGGSHADALARIRGPITLQVPHRSRFPGPATVTQADANALVRTLAGLDLAYFDPPYNQHPYGSNYFMLNLLVSYRRPERVSRVSGIPADWQRSAYNARGRCRERLRDLIAHTDARFVLLSFNDEGFVAPAELRALLAAFGPVEEVATPYAAFRGSRNLSGRRLRVTEHLFLLERR